MCYKCLEHSQWIRRLGVRVPLKSRHFLSQRLLHFHNNIRWSVENECCCPCKVNISNVNFATEMCMPPEPIFKNMGQQMSGPDSSNGQSIRHESEGCGIFCLKNIRHFHKNIRSWIENECCCPHTFDISNVNFTIKCISGPMIDFQWFVTKQMVFCLTIQYSITITCIRYGNTFN